MRLSTPPRPFPSAPLLYHVWHRLFLVRIRVRFRVGIRIRIGIRIGIRFRGQVSATGASESFFDGSLLDLIDDLEVGLG